MADADSLQSPNDLGATDYPILADDTPERAAERFRLAMQLMRQHEAPAIPLNYALCYFYAAGSNLLFNEKMDHQLNHGITRPRRALSCVISRRAVTPRWPNCSRTCYRW